MMTKILKHQLFIVIFTIFLDALGLAILLPITPILFIDPSSPDFMLPMGWSLNQGYILLGLLTAIFPLMQFFATPILGQLSDKFGRRKILFISLLGTAAGYLLFALGILFKNIPLLFVARALDGITGGNISVAQASIADVTKPEDRAKNFGLIGAAFGLGFVLGPFIGAKLSDPTILPFFSPAMPFYFATVLSMINAISVYFYFEETNKNLLAHLKINWNQSVRNIFKAFENKALAPLFTTGFLFNTGFGFFVSFFSVFLISKFNFTQGGVGDFFSFVGICIAFTQAVITRRVAKYFNETQVLRFTIIGDGLAIGAMFLATVWWGVYLIVPFVAIFNGLTFANLTGLLSRSADKSVQGEVLGINASLQALGQLIPPIIGGFLAAAITPEAPVAAASAIIVLAGLFFVFLVHPKFAVTDKREEI